MKRKTGTPEGKKIKKKLVDIGMTYGELGQLVGTSPVYISHIVNGYRSGDKYMKKIKEILGISGE